MRSFEEQIRAIIRELVQEEVRKAVAEALRPDEYLSPMAAAKVANVTSGTIRRWVRSGQLTRYGKGRLVRVKRSDLDRLLHPPIGAPTRRRNRYWEDIDEEARRRFRLPPNVEPTPKQRAQVRFG